MPSIPPPSLVALIHGILSDLLTNNPIATSSEKYVQNHIEFELIKTPVQPRYFIRIGINYHGNMVQHIEVVNSSNVLKGWNPDGDALGTGSRAKMLLAEHTIYKRDPNEPIMSDTKIGGGQVSPGRYIRVEYKARGWLGQTKNLDGKQLEKDLDLLKNDNADLLVLCLSETAHLKWRGEGPAHQAARRSGIGRFCQLLLPIPVYIETNIQQRDIIFEEQPWTISSQRIIGAPSSIMPGAEHFVTLCWRRDSTTMHVPGTSIADEEATSESLDEE